MFVFDYVKNLFVGNAEPGTEQNDQQRQNSSSGIKSTLSTALKFGAAVVVIATTAYLQYKSMQSGFEAWKPSNDSDDNFNPLPSNLNEFSAFNELDTYANIDKDFLQHPDLEFYDPTSPEGSYRRSAVSFRANSLIIDEGQTVVITKAMLEATDNMCDDFQRQFSVINVENGQFEYVSNPGVAVFTFTQQDINDDAIQFRHDGGEAAPSYDIKATCTETSDTTGYQQPTITFTNINDVPDLVTYHFTICQNETVILDGTMLNAIDPDNTPDALTFTVEDVQNGFFYRTTAPQTSITTFTQQEVDDGDIRFKHYDVELAPSFRVKVDDGGAATDYVDAIIDFCNVNDPPKIENNQFTIEEGQTIPVDETMISVIDPDNNSTSLVFTAEVQHGFFSKVNDLQKTPITTFTMEDIFGGKIQVTHDGTEHPMTCRIKVSDEEFETDFEETLINYNPVNDMPQFESNELIKIERGSEVVLTANMLNVIDPDNHPTEIGFLVKSLSHGNIERTDQPGSISSFSLQDIQDGKIKLVHDGSSYAPAFSFSITDGENETEGYQAGIEFRDPTDTNVDDDTIDDTVSNVPIPSFPTESIIIGGVAGGACLFFSVSTILGVGACAAVAAKNKKDKEFRESMKKIELVSGSFTESFKAEHQIKFKAIKLEKRIGGGGGGDVFKAIWENRDVAYKSFTLKNEDTIRSFEREARLLLKLNHPNIVRMFGVCIISADRAGIIMEYMPMGSLRDVLRDIKLSWHQIWGISKDVILGLVFLHKNNIMHRDIKSGNVLIHKEGDQLHAKLTDFGLSKQQTTEETATCAMGTYKWMAPELITSEKPVYRPSCDMYSIGLLFFAIVTGEQPFSGITNTIRIPMKIAQGELKLDVPKNCSPKYAELMQSCWSRRAEERPSAEKVKNDLNKHEYEIINYQEDEIINYQSESEQLNTTNKRVVINM
ncbi:MAG: cadherin-like domain-containing protein [Candidatus Neomarinimicrobiota bacterium]